MIIKSVHVRNFRSILNESLECDPLTALVGPNGSGKSSFLRALELFYAASPRLDSQDFYAEDITQQIEIAVTFTDLGEEERERFGSYLEDGDLTVVRVLSISDDKPLHKCYGSRLTNPEFAFVRNAAKVAEARPRYEELRRATKYADLPQWSSREQAESALDDWEHQHLSECVRRRDEGQFFGFTEVGQGYLGKYTKFISIAAVRDAAIDAEEGRGSAVKEIIDLVVRSSLAAHKDLRELREETKERYSEIIDPSNLGDLQILQERLTSTLKTFVPDAGVSLSWADPGEFQFPLPKTDVRLIEDGYPSGVGRTGHGLQRAFILTMLQHLAVARAPAQQASESEPTEGVSAGLKELATDDKLPDVILGIEEPELYQHPNRQRHIAMVLLQLASGAIPGVAQKTQVIYSTHSPAFVGLDRFNQVRLFRKVAGPQERPKITRVVMTSLDAIAAELWGLNGRPGERWTGETLLPRLYPLMTPWMNEGFFADVVVLVEGEEDRAAIIGVALSMGLQFESSGISVIPCMGKSNIDRPALIFRAFGIRTFIIWDGDEGGDDPRPEVNRRLLRLLGQPEQDYPHEISDHYACFRTTLAEALKNELGAELFETLLTRLQDELGIAKRKDAFKNAVLIRKLIEAARSTSQISPTLENIIRNIVTLKERVATLGLSAGTDATGSQRPV